MEDGVKGTGQKRRTSPRREFGQAKKQVATPADLLTEKETVKMIVVMVRLRTALPKPGAMPGKRTTPKAGAMLKLTAMNTAGPMTAISSPRPRRGLNPTPAQIARRPPRGTVKATVSATAITGTAILISGAMPAR
jgi:hypothetical protein